MLDPKIVKDIQSLVRSGWRLPALTRIFGFALKSEIDYAAVIKREYELFWDEKMRNRACAENPGKEPSC